MPDVPLQLYDLVVADPPYSASDAERYGVAMVNRNKVMHELGERLPPGAFVVWLDQVYPMCTSVQLQPEARNRHLGIDQPSHPGTDNLPQGPVPLAIVARGLSSEMRLLSPGAPPGDLRERLMPAALSDDRSGSKSGYMHHLFARTAAMSTSTPHRFMSVGAARLPSNDEVLGYLVGADASPIAKLNQLNLQTMARK
jgi:hypothetical protein